MGSQILRFAQDDRVRSLRLMRIEADKSTVGAVNRPLRAIRSVFATRSRLADLLRINTWQHRQMDRIVLVIGPLAWYVVSATIGMLCVDQKVETSKGLEE